ncbi:MAG: bifunctional [glutamate--ammonia ligase]-adenylyl-L-tyrosine phosphorylase/[glutamate--ammonia-ligase] adenylyltransferase [Nitrospirota bacterium]
MNIYSLIKDASLATPDPERSEKNLFRILREFPELIAAHEAEIGRIAVLCAYSQFLADYCVKNPASLSHALTYSGGPRKKEEILEEARSQYASFAHEENPALYKQRAIALLRNVKKENLLLITLRDVSGITHLNEYMAGLTSLADAIIELALDIAFTMMRRRSGLLRDNAFSLIGMGKLGAGELNYSSDIDIITVFRSDSGSSTGTLNPFGIRQNTISSHEYYCTLIEILTTLLQLPTEDGIAYRVDLRLRPNGQKGSLSLSLNTYRAYYEAWGKTWERMALIRARHVAGDHSLSGEFLSAIEPFVWKKSTDYSDIEEVKELKKRIDAAYGMSDIKRGYGGIREIEFFVQTFQLLYGGEKRSLRARLLTDALEVLKTEEFLTAGETAFLSDSYYFLRRIEHILQMRDDMQTYSLPSDSGELAILARKMHFEGESEFSAALRLKRLKIRDMYNSLLGGPGTAQDDMVTLTEQLPEDSMLDYIAFKGFRKPDAALKNLRNLLEQISIGKTLRERNLLRKTLPPFLELTVKSVHKDRALGMLVSFIQKIGNHESYIDLLLQRADTREILITTFSASTLLTRMLLSLDNLEGIFEYPDFRADHSALLDRLTGALERSDNPLGVIRQFKYMEELKTCMLFLKGSLDAHGLSHLLTALADTIIKSLTRHLDIHEGFAVIGLGALGAHELNVGSDLDLMFIHAREGTVSSEKNPAADIIRFLSEYTSGGFAYKVDMRLRPDGAKGILVNDLEGYESYYARNAQPWEIQSLLRARPLAGDTRLSEAFDHMKKRIISSRGPAIKGSDMRSMRTRIINQISKESAGADLKNGPGGIKEIEFLIQYLQIKHAAECPSLITQNTSAAAEQLKINGFLDEKTAGMLLSAHGLLKTLDTILRLNEENVLKNNSEIVDIILSFLGLPSGDVLFQQVKDTREKVLRISKKIYA